MTEMEMEAKEIVGDLPTALIRWYPFRRGGRLLLWGNDGKLAEMLRSVFQLQVTVTDLHDAEDNGGEFDYIVCIGCLESEQKPVASLTKVRKKLAKGGVMLLGVNNRLGLRYFCGDHDPYTLRCYDGVENYRHAGVPSGRMYARSELEEMLSEAGWERRKLYAVLPSLEEPVFLFADGQVPKEDLANRLFPNYNYPHSIFLEEEPIYSSLADNNMFHAMANAYLIECSPDGDLSDALYVTSSLERGRKNAMLTVIHRDGTVCKEAAYPEGEKRLTKLAENMETLRKNGVPVLEGKLEAGAYVMPYIENVTGQVYLKELLLKDKAKFLEMMDAFRDAILSSSSIHSGEFCDVNGNKVDANIFDTAFLDMVPLNSFFLNGKFVFFDQEFSEQDCPVGLVLHRMIASFYAGNYELENILPADELYDRYGILEYRDTWWDMDGNFLKKIRKEMPLSTYHKQVRRDEAVMQKNRRRMNYPARDPRRLFFDIFQDADTKKLVLFGSGRYAREFMDLYRVRYPVHAIVDNNEKAWGQEIHGVTVQSPELLKSFQPGECKVLVCIKQFLSVMEQLEDMGVEDYSIFDPGKSYALPKVPLQEETVTLEGSKPYHVGYVAGVFDLFHIGHLNILRRAKEQCDYLIVGVVSDRQVREGKKVEPFVPFEERLEMVKSCRYVDEAHEIPYEHPDTDMAWKLYRFDVQFSGSDYEHDPVWLAKKKWLEERGSTMVFFPYTQSTSSTHLKKLIEKRLL